jgi:membrane-bound lytic murein transglycosylase B
MTSTAARNIRLRLRLKTMAAAVVCAVVLPGLPVAADPPSAPSRTGGEVSLDAAYGRALLIGRVFRSDELTSSAVARVALHSKVFTDAEYDIAGPPDAPSVLAQQQRDLAAANPEAQSGGYRPGALLQPGRSSSAVQQPAGTFDMADAAQSSDSYVPQASGAAQATVRSRGLWHPAQVERVAATTGIPARALQAYAWAALRQRRDQPGCGLSWTTLAAIGRVESVHGTLGGATLGVDGRPSRPIYGVPLDGRPGVRAIRDSDRGTLDGDTVWDRAVGPMQFIPTTWVRWGVDADGDGAADPQQIDDAALAAARYLCASGRSLTDPEGLREGLLSYNRSQDYADTVTDLDRRYTQDSRGWDGFVGGGQVPDGQARVGAGGFVCPTPGVTWFMDDWGFPRSGGRRHQGNDLFAPEGSPVVATADGRVIRMQPDDVGLGGRTVSYLTDDGDVMYNAHLHTVAPGLKIGDRLSAGQQIGTVGRTGNARTTPPHLHFGIYPSSGVAVPPYPYTSRACR